MIQNHKQLKVTQEQLQRLEYALEELKRTVTTAELAAQTSAIVEHIRRLRSDIDEYLGIIVESTQ